LRNGFLNTPGHFPYPGKRTERTNEALIAETAALYHDIGRFTQYARYKTFKDSISENHGRIGARVLSSEGTLERLSGREQELITNTVRFHSAFSIPALQDAEKKFFLKLVRDSDKLDIWRVFIDYYNTDEKERTSAIGQELPDTPGYSRDVVACIHERKMASLSRLKNLNDFKITQLSWVFDLNFSSSFRLLLDRDYLQLIIAKLPQNDEIKKLSDTLHAYAQQRCEQPY
jgi:hypothetical protein